MKTLYRHTEVVDLSRPDTQLHFNLPQGKFRMTIEEQPYEKAETGEVISSEQLDGTWWKAGTLIKCEEHNWISVLNVDGMWETVKYDKRRFADHYSFEELVDWGCHYKMLHVVR